MTELQVYLWLMLDNVKSLLGLFGGIPAVICTSVAIAGVDELTASQCKKIFVVFIIGCLICSFALLTPSSKQYAMIKVFPKIANSEVVQEIPEDMTDMYKMAKEYMKDMLVKEGE